MAYSGKFYPKNPQKYRGDHSNIIYRSTWERKVMCWLDERDDVLEWGSEEFCIPYVSPVDGRWHRYFPDFQAKIRGQDGKPKTYVIEVKPKKQSVPPQVRTRKTKAYINEVVTWGINEAKWRAAQEYCKDRNWSFTILTEDDLFKSS